MTHRNAPLAPEGRRRACLEVDRGRPICHVAAEFHIARQTLGKWHARWLEFGEEGLEDRSSRPLSSPNRTPLEIEDLIEALRREHKMSCLRTSVTDRHQEIGDASGLFGGDTSRAYL